MAIFGESAKERELRQEIAELRQQLQAAKDEAASAWQARDEERLLRTQQAAERDKQISAMQHAHDATKKRLLNTVRYGQRKDKQYQANLKKH